MSECGATVDDCGRGPYGQENWRRALAGRPPHSGSETPLYSDSHVVGDVDDQWGPYQVLNTIAGGHGTGCQPVLVLRTIFHGIFGEPDFNAVKTTDTSRFHGGGIEDEIASLIGLRLGIRLRASSKTRDIQFDPPHERPRAEDPGRIPCLFLTSSRMLILLTVVHHAKVNVDILRGYPSLPDEGTVALVKAARSFQHGMWLAENNPSDAWLMFISAVEVAAVQWRKDEADNDMEKLFRSLKPAWAKRLDQTGDSTVVPEMARNWADLLKSTDRFIKFIIAHLPEPPVERPPFGHQVNWTKKNVRSGLDKIYLYRSKALHNGIPFPIPMCSPPFPLGEDTRVLGELPAGLATASLGGVWLQEDCPMHLHMFMYIVRGALIKWWDNMTVGQEEPFAVTE